MGDPQKQANLARRSALFRAIREFFYRHGFLEVETPVKIHAPAPEEYIESVQAEGDFLRTSPELAMKGMLADGFERIFQIGSCFRAGEFGFVTVSLSEAEYAERAAKSDKILNRIRVEG